MNTFNLKYLVTYLDGKLELKQKVMLTISEARSVPMVVSIRIVGNSVPERGNYAS